MAKASARLSSVRCLVQCGCRLNERRPCEIAVTRPSSCFSTPSEPLPQPAPFLLGVAAVAVHLGVELGDEGGHEVRLYQTVLQARDDDGLQVLAH